MQPTGNCASNPSLAGKLARWCSFKPLKCGVSLLTLPLMCQLGAAYGTCDEAANSHEPALACAKNKCSLTLPDEMRKVISQAFPGFEPYAPECFPEYYPRIFHVSSQDALFAVVGDFNGDGRQDVALLGPQGERELCIAVVSAGQAYKAFLINSSPRTEECGSVEYFLSYAAPGWHTEWLEEPTTRKFRISNPAFELVYDEKSSELFAFQDGEFHKYVTGD